jgi:hypothetical protein
MPSSKKRRKNQEDNSTASVNPLDSILPLSLSLPVAPPETADVMNPIENTTYTTGLNVPTRKNIVMKHRLNSYSKKSVVNVNENTNKVAILGIDPGIRSPLTVYYRKKSDTEDSFSVFSLGLQEWRSRSGITAAEQERNKIFNRNISIQQRMSNLKSLKTVNLEDHVEHVAQLLEGFNDFFNFYSERFSKLKFTSYVKKQKAVATICNSIIDIGEGAKVVIGFGNFRQQHGSACNRGNPSSPIQTFKKVILYIIFIYLFVSLFIYI